MSKYHNLCRQMERSAPITEYEDNPHLDTLQEAWLRLLEARRKAGRPNPEATTVEELCEQYTDDGGLLVTMYHGVKIDKKRRLKFRGTADMENTVDERVDRELEAFELKDWLVSELANLSEAFSEAISDFIQAWQLQEMGEKVPIELSRKISQHRKNTGLPLVLQRGRR